MSGKSQKMPQQKNHETGMGSYFAPTVPINASSSAAYNPQPAQQQHEAYANVANGGFSYGR